jgi:hypothetical protein
VVPPANFAFSDIKKTGRGKADAKIIFDDSRATLIPITEEVHDLFHA